MITPAIIFQALAIICFIVHLVMKEAESDQVKPGQVYEQLYEGTGTEPSSVFLKTVLDVKDGYVKCRLQGYRLDDGGEFVVTLNEIKKCRLIKEKTNPFETETKQ